MDKTLYSVAEIKNKEGGKLSLNSLPGKSRYRKKGCLYTFALGGKVCRKKESFCNTVSKYESSHESSTMSFGNMTHQVRFHKDC